MLNCEFLEAAALAFSGNNLAARCYQTFDTLYLRFKPGQRNKYFPTNLAADSQMNADKGASAKPALSGVKLNLPLPRALPRRAVC
jgi:hypothetical protein